MRLSYFSKTPGIGGSIKQEPDDFLVEEIMPDGTLLEKDMMADIPDQGGDFTRFILQKRDWTTSSALHEIGRRLGIGKKSLSFAGTKDKTAISVQQASAYRVPKERLLALGIKDIRINGAWTAKDKVRLGELLGNRFTVRVRDAKPDAPSTVAKIQEELGDRFPNFFGEQRFGSNRRNTMEIGLSLLKGDAEGAVRIFLCDSEGERNPLAKEARQGLGDTGDYMKALKEFPKHLRLERSVIDHLALHPGDHEGALRRLPRTTLLLFIHAFQSHVFNRQLSDRIAEGGPELEIGEYYCGESMGFPDISKTEAEGWIAGKLIGYGSPINDRERALLEEHGVEKEDFRMKRMPEIASKGTYRTMLSPVKDLDISGDTFRFSLPAGSYATVLMREFMDSKA